MIWSKGAFNVGRILGIRIRIHWTFFLLVLFLALESASWGGKAAAIMTVIQIAAIFLFVTLHELGHSLTARKFGIPVRAITLWPLGGVAEFETIEMRPREEFWITVAGPAVNFALALLFAPLAFATFVEYGWIFPAWLVAANLSLGLFNLIPAFPMDGGRILRAWLASRSGNRLRATEQAVAIGKVAAIGLGILGMVVNPWLLVLAFFAFTLGQRELEQARYLEALRRESVRPEFPFPGIAGVDWRREEAPEGFRWGGIDPAREEARPLGEHPEGRRDESPIRIIHVEWED